MELNWNDDETLYEIYDNGAPKEIPEYRRWLGYNMHRIYYCTQLSRNLFTLMYIKNYLDFLIPKIESKRLTLKEPNNEVYKKIYTYQKYKKQFDRTGEYIYDEELDIIYKKEP